MEIFVDVEVHGGKGGPACNSRKFLFHTFSYNHDIFLVKNIGGEDSIVAVDGTDVDLDAVWLRDADYIRSVVQYAIDKGFVVNKFLQQLIVYE